MIDLGRLKKAYKFGGLQDTYYTDIEGIEAAFHAHINHYLPKGYREDMTNTVATIAHLLLYVGKLEALIEETKQKKP